MAQTSIIMIMDGPFGGSLNDRVIFETQLE